MHEGLECDYEFQFTGDFDQAVYNACNVSDAERTDQMIIDIVNQIKVILENLPGINTFATFCATSTQRYKVTLTRA